MRHGFTFWISIPALVLLMACGRDAPGADEERGVDAAGAEASAVSRSSTGDRDAGVRWRIEEVMRIGTLDGDGPTVLGRIGAIEVDAERNILVFDGFAQELRVFTQDGLHQMSFGRAGDGPGEFQGVLGMALEPDGGVRIVDGRNARYTVVGRDGSFESFPRGSSAVVMGRPWVGGSDLNGLFYDYSVERQAHGVDQLMLRVGTAGEEIDRFIIPRIDVPQPDFGAGGVTVALPFAPRALRACDPRGRVWQALSSEYRIANIALDGDTILLVSRMGEPTRLTNAQRDSVDAAVRRVERQMGQTVDPSLYPTTIPPLRWFAPDDEDRLWVCATGMDACTELDVFDAAGAFLGTVDLPAPVLDLPRPIVRDGYFYAAVEGEFGVPQVFVGRIVVPEE